MLRMLATLLLFAAATAWAQADAPAVTEAMLDAAVEQVSSSGTADDPQRQALLKLYSETRAALVAIPKYQGSQKNYTLARENALGQAEAIQQKLARLETTAEETPEYPALAKMPLPELEQKLQLDKAELAAQKTRLSEIRAALDEIKDRPAKVRARLTELVGLGAQLKEQLALAGEGVEAGTEAKARLWLAQAQAASLAAEKAALDEELLSQPMRQQLLTAQQDQAILDIAELESRVQFTENRAAELRQGEVMQATVQAQQEVAEAADKHPMVQQLADSNAELAASFTQRSAAIQRVRQRRAMGGDMAEKLENDLKSIRKRLELIGMSTAVGESLREHQALMPPRGEIRKQLSANAKAIVDSSLQQLELEDERLQLRDARNYVDGLLVGQDPQIAGKITDDLQVLARTRRDLIGQAIDLETTYSQALGNLDFALQRYESVTDDYREFLAARLLWMPSREMFTLLRGGALSSQLAEMFSPSRWLVMLGEFPGQLLRDRLALGLLLVFLALQVLTRRLVAKIAATSQEVGFVRTDQFSSTLAALGLSLLLSLKWPLLLFIAARLFDADRVDPFLSEACYLASMGTAFYAWGLGFLRVLLLPGGLVDDHLRWPDARTTSLYQGVVRLELTFLPAVFLGLAAQDLYPKEVGGPLAALAMICVLLSTAYFFYRLPVFMHGKLERMFSDGSARGETRFGRLSRWLLVWLPVVATVVVVLGYTYAVIEFTLLFVRTTGLFCLLLLVHELGLRWLRMTRRRMSARVREELESASADDKELSPEEELLENDPALLNDEGTRLLNLVVMFGGIFGFAAVWAEVLPALGVLDSVELWHRTGVVDGLEVQVPVTLRSVLVALLIAVLGWLALNRIPGLLELLLRQKMNVTPASAYAASRIFQYVAVTVLVIMVLGSLGANWSQIQWAVAALSVGIGFGLQEIVANFISGLIILFEQPIRLGDTITVGNVSGTVTKIRIRATTIRDFDQRELLVPNKEFITQQLLNWSLSDSVTRWVLEVGVAYGTDMDQAMAVVKEAAQTHPLVLEDPAPFVTFEEFGDNSLLILLRFYMDDMDKRLSVASEVRLEINRRLNEAGIVVAFPQRDVHLDTSQPLAVRMVDQSSPPSGQ